MLEAEISASLIHDEEGRTQDALLVFDDISRRKWAEERRRRSTAQAGLEEMAVTIAHGIRNPLASIELLVAILADEVRGDVRKSRLAHDIQSAVASVNTILTNLVAFSRPLRVRLKLLDLHTVIEDALSTALYALKERQIDLIRLYHRGPLEVEGDRELLKQVFLNLILNAVQAMPSGGRLRIITRVLSSECQVPHLGPTPDAAPRGAQVHERGTPPTDELIEVVVSDSGCGIRQSDLDKIFLPFFTTKAKGTGLGLAVAERILDQHGARINLESQTGKGTTFTMRFTRKREAGARALAEDLA
jgi:signal transduction histidine kinase